MTTNHPMNEAHDAPSGWEAFRHLDPDFFEGFRKFARVPMESAGGLSLKEKHLISMAINASTTGLHMPSTRLHMRSAGAEGATREEIVQVLELVSMMGIHAITEGVPILHEELSRAGVSPPAQSLQRQEGIRERFVREKGYWSPFWDSLLALDPDFFEAWIEFSLLPVKAGPLGMKMVHLVYVACDVSSTHLYNPGTRIHMRGAIADGATAREILDVLELAVLIGIHTMTESASICLEETPNVHEGD